MSKVTQVGSGGHDSNPVVLAPKPLVLTLVSHHLCGPVLRSPKSGNLILRADPLAEQSGLQLWDLLKVFLPVSGMLGVGRGSCWPSSGTADCLFDGSLETLFPMVSQVLSSLSQVHCQR